MREQSDADLQVIRSMGWRRPSHTLISGRSILLDLSSNDDDWLKSIDGKHRYYVRKSAGAALSWAHGNSAALRRDLANMTQTLNVEKGMNLPEWDAQDMESLDRCMPNAICILVGCIESRPVTGCLVLMQGTSALYLSAATLKEGRGVSAAYSMFSTLRRILREQNIRVLDFGGIDPASDTARGVDHFKRGFGGREMSYLGEWDWATPSILRLAANQLIKRRAGGT